MVPRLKIGMSDIPESALHNCPEFWDKIQCYCSFIFRQVPYRNQCPLLCLVESRCLGYRLNHTTDVGAALCEFTLADWFQLYRPIFNTNLFTHSIFQQWETVKICMVLKSPFSLNHQKPETPVARLWCMIQWARVAPYCLHQLLLSELQRKIFYWLSVELKTMIFQKHLNFVLYHARKLIVRTNWVCCYYYIIIMPPTQRSC